MHAHEHAPRVAPDGSRRSLAVCVEACHDAAVACAAAADARLEADAGGSPADFVRIARDCMDVCVAVEAIAARRGPPDNPVLLLMLEAAAQACIRFAAACAAAGDSHHDFRLGALAGRHAARRCEEAAALLVAPSAARRH